MIRRIVGFIAIAIGFTSGPLQAEPLAVGERYPDLTLANIADGQPVSLAGYRGKKVLLIQFASW